MSKQTGKDRTARLAEARSRQRTREQRMVVGIVVACLVLLAGSGAVILYAVNARGQTLAGLGTPPSACDAATPAEPGAG